VFAAMQNPDIAKIRGLFLNPPDDCRVMMRWWWFGPSVTKGELEREMRLMKEGGIGGFEIQPVYPLALDEAEAGIKNLPYLSDSFLEMLRFTSEKARELGLRMDLTLGSGWPYGGPEVSIRDAAGKLRIVRVPITEESRRIPVPAQSTAERLMAVFLCETVNGTIIGDRIRELQDIRDGAVQLGPSLRGPHELLFFLASRTGMMVKRPAVGGEGFVVNHYSQPAVGNYLRGVGDRLIQAFRVHRPYAVFCDSLEVYGSDWTDDLLQEFRKRRGYDLRPHLPQLALDLGPETTSVREDWGRTLTELFNERFMATMRAWSRRNGTLFRIQAYGIPPATLSSYSLADLAEGEGSQWKALSASRWASSASHLLGRGVTSSETWTWLHSPAFRATPLDMKAEANRHFLQGINQLIGHGWPYTAEGAEYPGWRFYAAGAFNEKNPWWIVMPDVMRYLQRSSFMLRQGQPVNDVALYLPVNDAWASFTPGRVNLLDALRERVGPDVIGAVLESGFNFDFFDDETLKQFGKVEGNLLKLGPNHYRAVILPGAERIPETTLKTLREFSRSGGIVIASLPTPMVAEDVAVPRRDSSRLPELSFQAFLQAADEKRQLSSTLRGAVQPDVVFFPEAPNIGFVHRKTADVEIYFLANTSNLREKTRASFRISGLLAEWWDPMTGLTTPAHPAAVREGRTDVTLDLEPYGARFLVFSHHSNTPLGDPIVAETPLLDLSEGWQVTFGNGGMKKTLVRLESWTDDASTRYFSGVAVYEKDFSVLDKMLKSGLALQLDLGLPKALSEVSKGSNGMQSWLESPIGEAAVVYVNERRAGSVWAPPYSVDVTGLMKGGINRLKILVANTAVNYMAGRALPDYRLLNLRYGMRFEPQDMDKIRPVSSGLLGPIRLLAGTRD
jgi:hypothetical protein